MAAPQRNLKKTHISILLLLFLGTIVSVLIALSIGSSDISFADVLASLFGNESNQAINQIILQIRLPRILLALSAGGGLAVAGTVLQAMLMNPLAEPYILGISSGGAFGALFALVLGLSFLFVQVFAFAGAISVMLMVFILGKRFGELEPNILLLSGVMISAFFSAALLLLVFFMNDSLRTAVYWMMGNLSIASADSVFYILPVSIAAAIIFSFNSHKLNLLSFGSGDATHMGVNVNKIKNLIYIVSSILVGAIVSVSGIIGFVGLLVPHVCRMILGFDNRLLVPASFFTGAIYLIFADTLARTIISPAELPVGAITAVLGAPLFIYLLRKRFRVF